MAKNPLKGGGDPPPPKLTAQQWCDLGNDKLAGRIPCSDGKPARDPNLPPVRWVVRNGVPTIEFVNVPESSLGKKVP